MVQQSVNDITENEIPVTTSRDLADAELRIRVSDYIHALEESALKMRQYCALDHSGQPPTMTALGAIVGIMKLCESENRVHEALLQFSQAHGFNVPPQQESSHERN